MELHANEPFFSLSDTYHLRHIFLSASSSPSERIKLYKRKGKNNLIIILFNHKSIYYHFAGIEQKGSIKKINDGTEVNTNKPSGSQVKILGCYISQLY